MGSRFGSGEQGCYVAILPFVLAPGAKLDSQEGTITTSDGSFTYKLEKHTDFYTISLETFDSTDMATMHLDKLRAILLWLSLTRRVGLSYAKSCAEVTLYGVPITDSQINSFHDWDRIDGFYNLNVEEAIILPQDKNILRIQGFRPSVTVGLSSVDFSKAINDVLAFPHPEGVVGDHKLKLASEIYAGYRFDSSRNSKFISLWTALEALIPDVEISQRAQEALERAQNVVKEERHRHERDSQEWRAIDALHSRLGNFKTESTRTALKKYVSKYVSSVISKCPGLGTEREVFAQLDSVYRVRSRLVHDGHAGRASNKQQFEKSFSFLNKFVPLLLEESYRKAAGLDA